MRPKTIITLLSGLAVMLLTGCDVKDPIYNTAHPDKGKITLTTDWTARTAGIEIPASYTVKVGDYTATVSGATNTINNLFAPGDYRAHIYNAADNITVSGVTAAVASATAPAGQSGGFVSNAPGWFFSCAMDAMIEKDTDHAFTAAMQQQVRQLTLLVEPSGGTTGKIERIEGYLSGAASTLDIDDGTHAVPLNVAMTFTKVTEGANAGKWSATVRLLGVAGTQQKLHATIYFKDNSPEPVSLTDGAGNEGCDLTTELAAFNADKKTPLTLDGKVVETPTGTGFSATIKDWTKVAGDPVVAN